MPALAGAGATVLYESDDSDVEESPQRPPVSFVGPIHPFQLVVDPMTEASAVEIIPSVPLGKRQSVVAIEAERTRHRKRMSILLEKKGGASVQALLAEEDALQSLDAVRRASRALGEGANPFAAQSVPRRVSQYSSRRVSRYSSPRASPRASFAASPAHQRERPAALFAASSAEDLEGEPSPRGARIIANKATIAALKRQHRSDDDEATGVDPAAVFSSVRSILKQRESEREARVHREKKTVYVPKVGCVPRINISVNPKRVRRIRTANTSSTADESDAAAPDPAQKHSFWPYWWAVLAAVKFKRRWQRACTARVVSSSKEIPFLTAYEAHKLKLEVNLCIQGEKSASERAVRHARQGQLAVNRGQVAIPKMPAPIAAQIGAAKKKRGAIPVAPPPQRDVTPPSAMMSGSGARRRRSVSVSLPPATLEEREGPSPASPRGRASLAERDPVLDHVPTEAELAVYKRELKALKVIAAHVLEPLAETQPPSDDADEDGPGSPAAMQLKVPLTLGYSPTIAEFTAASPSPTSDRPTRVRRKVTSPPCGDLCSGGFMEMGTHPRASVPMFAALNGTGQSCRSGSPARSTGACSHAGGTSEGSGPSASTATGVPTQCPAPPSRRPLGACVPHAPPLARACASARKAEMASEPKDKETKAYKRVAVLQGLYVPGLKAGYDEDPGHDRGSLVAGFWVTSPTDADGRDSPTPAPTPRPPRTGPRVYRSSRRQPPKPVSRRASVVPVLEGSAEAEDEGSAGALVLPVPTLSIRGSGGGESGSSASSASGRCMSIDQRDPRGMSIDQRDPRGMSIDQRDPRGMSIDQRDPRGMSIDQRDEHPHIEQPCLAAPHSDDLGEHASEAPVPASPVQARHPGSPPPNARTPGFVGLKAVYAHGAAPSRQRRAGSMSFAGAWVHHLRWGESSPPLRTDSTGDGGRHWKEGAGMQSFCGGRGNAGAEPSKPHLPNAGLARMQSVCLEDRRVLESNYAANNELLLQYKPQVQPPEAVAYEPSVDPKELYATFKAGLLTDHHAFNERVKDELARLKREREKGAPRMYRCLLNQPINAVAPARALRAVKAAIMNEAAQNSQQRKAQIDHEWFRSFSSRLLEAPGVTPDPRVRHVLRLIEYYISASRLSEAAFSYLLVAVGGVGGLVSYDVQFTMRHAAHIFGVTQDAVDKLLKAHHIPILTDGPAVNEHVESASLKRARVAEMNVALTLDMERLFMQYAKAQEEHDETRVRPHAKRGGAYRRHAANATPLSEAFITPPLRAVPPAPTQQRHAPRSVKASATATPEVHTSLLPAGSV
eukprot:TRINITY_DN3972_c0_g1_i1.p1 TRINITY_DN3972_c0_g1~~TRINITY_DN3972_c0_g1_i1.p1  ORF type:complete len:1295 (+),score=237.92 TRINITY_DN3972_c0_g1_i1:135-4019(+)